MVGRGFDEGPARATEAGLEAAGATSAKRAAAEGDAIAAINRTLKQGRPSKEADNERRSLATVTAAAGARYEAGTADVATATATVTATATTAGGGDMTAATSAATITKGTMGAGCKAKRRRRVDKYAAKARTTTGTEPL